MCVCVCVKTDTEKFITIGKIYKSKHQAPELRGKCQEQKKISGSQKRPVPICQNVICRKKSVVKSKKCKRLFGRTSLL